jgi:hypothetical protein
LNGVQAKAAAKFPVVHFRCGRVQSSVQHRRR